MCWRHPCPCRFTGWSLFPFIYWPHLATLPRFCPSWSGIEAEDSRVDRSRKHLISLPRGFTEDTFLVHRGHSCLSVDSRLTAHLTRLLFHTVPYGMMDTACTFTNASCPSAWLASQTSSVLRCINLLHQHTLTHRSSNLHFRNHKFLVAPTIVTNIYFSWPYKIK